MSTSKKWYAIYTMPRWEKKIAETLNKQDIVAYCPLNSVLKKWSDRKKIVQEPLFSCYVFVQVSDNEIIKVKEIDGVLDFVSWSKKPAVIRDVEIEVVKNFLNEHQNVQLEKIDVKVNDLVRIESGAFMQHEGSITAVKNNKVTVFLPALGYKLVAEVEKCNITVLAKPRITAEAHQSIARSY